MAEQITFEPKDLKKLQIVEQGICPEKFDHKDLPTDIHIVKYTVGGEVYFDVVRAYTKVDIFDAYYDKLKDIGSINTITSGYGNIRPNLYGKIKTN